MDRLNYEDSIFILNMRIRLIRDTLHLNPPSELFLEKSLDDLAFIAGALELLIRTIMENSDQYSGHGETEYLSDTEWQFNQALTEFSLETSPFSANIYPETMQKIATMRASSETRRKIIEANGHPLEIAQSEPVVTSAELNGLLGGV
jgi:hypothetical protein